MQKNVNVALIFLIILLWYISAIYELRILKYWINQAGKKNVVFSPLG